MERARSWLSRFKTGCLLWGGCPACRLDRRDFLPINKVTCARSTAGSRAEELRAQVAESRTANTQMREVIEAKDAELAAAQAALEAAEARLAALSKRVAGLERRLGKRILDVVQAAVVGQPV